VTRGTSVSRPKFGQGFEGTPNAKRRKRSVAIGTTIVALAASVLMGATSGAAEQPVSVPAPLPNNWLVLGDSVAHSFAPMFQMEALKHGVKVNQRTRPGCGMISAVPAGGDGSPIPWGTTCAHGTASYIEKAVAHFKPAVVVWHSSWEAADHFFNGALLAIGTPQGDAALIQEIETSISRITSSGARVVLVTNAPRTPFNNIGLAATEDLVRRTERLNQILAQVAEAHGDSVEIADLEAIVCPNGPPCPAYVGGVPLRPRDGSHFEGYGPGWLAPRLFAAIADVLTRGPTSSVEFD
jgi:SGNH domain-containing protein